MADLLSRLEQVVITEWTMHRPTLYRVWSIWGRPHLDLMATSMTNQLPIYVSPIPDPRAYAVDAMSFAWARMDVYVFPPWSMIAQVLSKLEIEHQCMMTIIVPRWPNRPWFPTLLSLLVDNPRRLPLRRDLIHMPTSHVTHGNLEMLDLHPCRLSSDVSGSGFSRAGVR